MDEAILLKTNRRAKWALYWSNIFQEPLSTMYGLLTFFLYKGLHATPFQVALLITLKPVIAILSFYWSSRSGGRLKANMIGAGILMRAPFLLCPWVDSVWYVIAAGVNYMLFYRAGTPAWMEIVKRNVKEGERGRAFSLSSAIGYGEGVLLSIAVGSLLDQDPGLWKMLCAGAAFLGLIGTAAQARVPVEEEPKSEGETLSWRELILRPWQDSIELMRRRKDFAAFQWGFMICGFAIMLIYPVLPLFAVDVLGISYTQMATAIAIAKGLGYVASSSLWGRWMGTASIYRLASVVFLIMALFPLLFALAKWHLIWFYIAYFWYGVGQGGSHLIWHMSGLHFAGKEESARYTGVGVMMVGLRGMIGPPIGSFLSVAWGALPVLGVGALLCLWSGLKMKQEEKKSLAVN